MSASRRIAATALNLLDAARDTATHDSVVRGLLTDVPSFRLLPGQVLRGEDEQATLVFAAGSDGVQLSSDNEVHTLHLRTSPDRRALFNDTRVDSLGCMLLADVTIIGVAPKDG
jgi:hypothetical protein